MRILITGVPAVGKTTIAKEIANSLGLRYVPEKDLLDSEMYDEIKYHGDLVKEVDIDMFSDKSDSIKEDVVFDGILFPETNLSFDAIIVLHLDKKTLRERMENRGYGDVKIEDNIYSQQVHYLDKLAYKLSSNVIALERTNVKEDVKTVLEWLERKKIPK